MPLQLATPSKPDRHLMQLVLIVPAALAITALLLWWSIWFQH